MNPVLAIEQSVGAAVVHVTATPVPDRNALLRTEKLAEGANWIYELKHDGFRALAIKTGGWVCLRSRNNNEFTSRYPAVAKALASIPNETVLDGEIVALDEEGRPSGAVSLFPANQVALHMYGPSGVRLRRRYYSVDSGADLETKTLSAA